MIDYVHWALMDNFESIFGYGLEVDGQDVDEADTQGGRMVGWSGGRVTHCRCPA